MPAPAVTPRPGTSPLTLLASDVLRMDDPVDLVPVVDRARRGAVAVRPRTGIVRRAEHGQHGALVYEAVQRGGHVTLQVWGTPTTGPDARDAALERARGWIGWHDAVPDLVELTAGHAALQRAARHIGPVRLSCLPTVGEAAGRAVLGQLVQAVEAHRSTAQLASLVGEPSAHGLWAWPTPSTMGRTPAYAMRRCGISLRGATALHRCALDDAPLERARHDFAALDRRLRTIPGVGHWTSAETRFALGDPDAVSVGDYNLPGAVCHALAGDTGDACTDERMLELLAPYRGQRGRVTRLVVRAVGRGLLPGRRRRAPRAAVSAHRYW